MTACALLYSTYYTLSLHRTLSVSSAFSECYTHSNSSLHCETALVNSIALNVTLFLQPFFSPHCHYYFISHPILKLHYSLQSSSCRPSFALHIECDFISHQYWKFIIHFSPLRVGPLSRLTLNVTLFLIQCWNFTIHYSSLHVGPLLRLTLNVILFSFASVFQNVFCRSFVV